MPPRRASESNPTSSRARQLRLGFDTQRPLLQTVMLVFKSGNELVISAMMVRPQMRDVAKQAGAK